MCQCDWAPGYPGSTLLLDESESISGDEISIWTGTRSRSSFPHWVTSMYLLRAWIGKKVEEERICLFHFLASHLSWGISSHLHLLYQLPRVSSFQMTTTGPLSLHDHEPLPHNRSISINIVSLENPNSYFYFKSLHLGKAEYRIWKDRKTWGSLSTDQTHTTHSWMQVSRWLLWS